MRCPNCRSMMFETETVKEGLSEQTWFECPTCGRTHLYSRLISGQEALENQRHREEKQVSIGTTSFAPLYSVNSHRPPG